MNKPASQTVRDRSTLTLSLPRIRLNANLPYLIIISVVLAWLVFQVVYFLSKGDSLTDNGNANPQCGGPYSMATLRKASFYCKPRKTGRYFNIRLVGNSMVLTLCEVEVYSESRGVVHFHLSVLVPLQFHFQLHFIFIFVSI